MKKLIINSDDYGRTTEISRGIRYAHLHGVVTSTTCMMNMPNTADDIKIALQEAPTLKMGVHLVLTSEKPILPRDQVESLVDENGWFLKYDPFVANLSKLNMLEVKAEWRIQIESFIAASGKNPSHLDSHHHSSCFSPALFKAMLELAHEYDCPIRFPYNGPDDPLPYLPPETIPSFKESGPRLINEFNPKHPDAFISHFYDEGATEGAILNIINTLPEGIHEFMCHPGYVDDIVVRATVYNQPRARELEILTSMATKEAIKENNIQLISFGDL